VTALGRAMIRSEKFQDALKLYRRVLGTQEQAFGAMNSSVTATMCELASVHIHLGEFDRAEQLFMGAVGMQREMHGDTHISVLQSLTLIGHLKLRRKHKVEALDIFKEVLEIQKFNNGLTSSETLGCMCLLGSLHLDMLQFKEARKILTDTFFCQAKALGEDHPETLETGERIALVDTLSKFSHILEDAGENVEGEKSLYDEFGHGEWHQHIHH
jgi:tetratricopeptide (TPR) repeat protein